MQVEGGKEEDEKLGRLEVGEKKVKGMGTRLSARGSRQKIRVGVEGKR